MNLYSDKTISPMLLHETKDAFNDENYLFELKFDGTRALIFVEPNKIYIKNRRGSFLNDTFPELINIKNIVKNKCIFDGEIITMFEGKPSFEKLQERLLLKSKEKINIKSKQYPVIFVCFDILYDKKDLTNLPLIERKKYLEKYKDNDFFVKTKYFLEKGIDLFKVAKEMNLEGIVAKEINSKYKINKRSKDWLKIKNLKDEDFYIGGYKINDNKGSLASLMLGKKEKNKFIYVCNVSIGKKRKEFKIIKQNKIINECPFKGFKEKGFIFIKPNLKCTVSFTEKTASNSLRQPIFKCLIYN